MSDQATGQAPPAEPTQPVKTIGDKSRDARDSTRKAREAKAAKRFAARNGADQEPTVEANTEEPAKPAATESPAESKSDETKQERSGADLNKRYAIVERREARLKKSEASVQERLDKASRAEANLSTRFGDPDTIVKQYHAGEFHVMAKTLEKWLGDSFPTITQKIARATAGLSPEKLKELEERDAFLREKREFEAAKKKKEQEETAGATREKARGEVTKKCSGHDVLKLKNGAELVLRTLEKHWDTDHFTISFKAAADMVLADKLAEAEALGLKRHTATVVDKKREEEPPTKREARHKPPVVVEEKRPGRLSFEERHAQAGRLLAKRRAQ